MSRRSRAVRRETSPDPRFESQTVTKFINSLMYDGKKSIAEGIFYDAMDILEQRSGQPGVTVFQQALNNAKPALEVKSRRVGGATYQVPIEVRPERRTALATPVADRLRPRAFREDHGRAAGSRAARGEPRRGFDHQEEGRHAPHGRGQQGVRPLSLVAGPAPAFGGRRTKFGDARWPAGPLRSR